MQIMYTLLMFCGIHGNTIFATFTPLTMAASAENLAALAAGEPLPNIITAPSLCYVSRAALAVHSACDFTLILFKIKAS